MTIKTPNHPRRRIQLAVVWQDSAWCPIVGRLRPPPPRQITWPAPVVTDINGCLHRDRSSNKL